MSIVKFGSKLYDYIFQPSSVLLFKEQVCEKSFNSNLQQCEAKAKGC